MDSSRVTSIRHELLTLHRALIDAARIELERIDGRLTANQMLDHLMMDERLAWLRPLTELIVGLDELLESEPPGDPAPYVVHATALLTFAPGIDATPFAAEYARLLHEWPEVTMAHAAAMRALTGPP
jgi:hypothetical protein